MKNSYYLENVAARATIKIISIKPNLELEFEGTFTDDQPFKGYYKGVVELPEEWQDK